MLGGDLGFSCWTSTHFVLDSTYDHFKSKDKTKAYSDKQNRECIASGPSKGTSGGSPLPIKKIPERKVGGGRKLVQSRQ